MHSMVHAAASVVFIMLEFFSVQTLSFKVFHCLTSDMQANYNTIPTMQTQVLVTTTSQSVYRDSSY